MRKTDQVNSYAIVLAAALAVAALGGQTSVAFGQVRFDAKSYEALAPASSAATIAPGTKITLQNWTKYRQFMPIGMQALFSGNYTWKIGAGPEYTIEVGPPLTSRSPEGTWPTQRSTAARSASRRYRPAATQLRITLQEYPFPGPLSPNWVSS